MLKTYKNFWSLNVDEAIVAGILRSERSENVKVFMPLNAQMKGTDLVLINIKSKRSLMLQVKGSRAYEPQRAQAKNFGDGSGSWFPLSKGVIDTLPVDFFIFLAYVIEQSLKTGRRLIVPHTIIIPTRRLKELAEKYKRHGAKNLYHFHFWINPKTKEAFDFRDEKYSVSEFLDKKGIERLNEELK